MRMAVDDDALYVPNVMAVAAARRAGVMPIGFVGSVADFADPDEFRRKVERARRLGFEGAFCIHPKQVPILNEAFAPNAQEVAHAQALLAEFESGKSPVAARPSHSRGAWWTCRWWTRRASWWRAMKRSSAWSASVRRRNKDGR